MIKRARLYLTRKYRRSALLFLLLFVISFSLAVGVTVWNSIGAVTKEVQDRLGTSFIFRLPSFITNDPSYYEDITDSEGNTQKYYVGPQLNDNTINHVMEAVSEVSTYNAEMDEYVYLDDGKLVEGMFCGDEDYKLFWGVTRIFGNSSTELYDKFRSGAFELVEGRHITPSDQYKTLISDEFAKLNGLQIGDTITLSQRAGIGGATDTFEVLGTPKTLEIVGIFHINGYQPTEMWIAEFRIAYNWFLTDLETVKYMQEASESGIYGNRAYEYKYRNVTFFVDDPAQLNSVMEDVKNIQNYDISPYEISVDDTMYRSTVEPLKSIRNIVAGVVGVIVAGCFIVLCVVFTMWVRSRRQEIAIYLSLGISKFKIIGQFVLEVSIVALAALALTFATCQQVPDLIGNSMLASTIEAAQPKEKEYSWEEIGQAAMSGTTSELFQYESSTYAGPESIDFSFGFVQLLVLAALELLIIIAAIFKGSSFIFKLQPRQILTTLR